ncbi:Nitroreductase [Thermoplasmatales archaeon BRNA1]|nr:Nitroreductase [Thermoplasmatales archaeon BRNA1]
MDFLELAKKRYSVRQYSDRKVEKEKLDLILEAARVAPTGCDYQPVRIYVIQSGEGLEKMRSLSKCTFGANTILLFTYDRDEEWNNPLENGVHSGDQDVSIVATHAMMEAEDLGLGTCWCNYFANSEVEKAFSLPPCERVVLFMTLGYPADDAQPLNLHFRRKPVEDIVRYL